MQLNLYDQQAFFHYLKRYTFVLTCRRCPQVMRMCRKLVMAEIDDVINTQEILVIPLIPIHLNIADLNLSNIIENPSCLNSILRYQ